MIEFIISCASGFVLGFIVREIILYRQIMAMSNLVRVGDSATNGAPRQLDHEIISGIHYFYDHVSKQYVCQGKDLEQAAKNYLKNSYCKQGYFIHCEKNKPYQFDNGNISTNNQLTL